MLITATAGALRLCAHCVYVGMLWFADAQRSLIEQGLPGAALDFVCVCFFYYYFSL
jgi:hypothetical protein